MVVFFAVGKFLVEKDVGLLCSSELSLERRKKTIGSNYYIVLASESSWLLKVSNAK